MEKVLNVAKAFYDMYYKQFGDLMDEMKMHKLMYFAQRESLMYNHELLFKEKFYGWKFGPVLLDVRQEYKSGSFSFGGEPVSFETAKLLQNVLNRYGSLNSWKLSSLSHNELSWKKARLGLKANDNGNVELSLDSMKADAARELAARNASNT